MAKNICLDCGHFLVCNKAEESIQQCSKFIKVHREVTKIEPKNIFDLDIKGFAQQVDSLLDNYTEDELFEELIQNGLEIERKDSNENNDKSTNEWQDK